MANRNRAEVKGAKQALERLKLEVAQELGISDYEHMDKGDLPARVNGKVGGLMVRKLIAMAEANMAADPDQINTVIAQHGANGEDIASVQAYSTNNGTNLH